MKLIGILLILFGVAALAFGGITYTDREQVLDLGPIEATTEGPQRGCRAGDPVDRRVYAQPLVVPQLAHL